MQEVYEFLKSAGTYYLATVENDQPRIRPFGTINLFENKLYIQSGKKKNVAKQIAQNPKVEICAMNNDVWLRISATLVEDDRIEAQKDMLNHYPELQSMYKAGDDNTVVYYLKNATATFASLTGTPKIIQF